MRLDLDIEGLHAFTEVADAASFSRAAERLHLTQPAVSKRIQALEERVGQPLFDRVARRVTLTDAGRTLLPYARRALQELEDGRRALSRLSEQVSGRLSIGTSHHIGLHRLPPLLRTFTQRYPEVDLDLHFMDSEVACEGVLAGELELGIVTLPAQPLHNLEQQVLWEDPLEVMAAGTHPLAHGRRVPIRALAKHAAVLPDEATYTHRIVRAALEAHGVQPHVRLATNYLETLKMLAGIGLGWTVLPRSMRDGELVALPVDDLRLQRQLGVVWHARRTRSGAAMALLQLAGVQGQSTRPPD